MNGDEDEGGSRKDLPRINEHTSGSFRGTSVARICGNKQSDELSTLSHSCQRPLSALYAERACTCCVAQFSPLLLHLMGEGRGN